MKKIPLLTERDIECRVQSVSKSRAGKVGAILLVYKDARVDMRILDEVYGRDSWQRTHEIIGGELYCNIDVWDEDKRCWVRKQDVGTESNTEKEKGRASDSFKRAGFNVGIGRELYSAPFIYVPLNEGEYYDGNDGKPRCSAGTKFSVARVGYDERDEINALEIVDARGVTRFKMGSTADKPESKPKPPKAEQGADECPTKDRLEKLYLVAASRGFSETSVRKGILKRYNKLPESMDEDEYQAVLAGYMALAEKAG